MIVLARKYGILCNTTIQCLCEFRCWIVVFSLHLFAGVRVIELGVLFLRQAGETDTAKACSRNRL